MPFECAALMYKIIFCVKHMTCMQCLWKVTCLFIGNIHANKCPKINMTNSPFLQNVVQPLTILSSILFLGSFLWFFLLINGILRLLLQRCLYQMWQLSIKRIEANAYYLVSNTKASCEHWSSKTIYFGVIWCPQRCFLIIYLSALSLTLHAFRNLIYGMKPRETGFAFQILNMHITNTNILIKVTFAYSV